MVSGVYIITFEIYFFVRPPLRIFSVMHCKEGEGGALIHDLLKLLSSALLIVQQARSYTSHRPHTPRRCWPTLTAAVFVAQSASVPPYKTPREDVRKRNVAL